MSPFEGRDLLCIRGQRRVFAALDFAVPAGGALVLSGPNGSGKSSLLRIMAGLLPPAAGSLTWAGRPIGDDAEAHRARLRYLGHLDAVKPVLSVTENLSFWAAIQGHGDAEAVARALDGFALGPLAAVPGRMLSAGQKRRLALARLLAAPAPLWLLDEPGVGLDRDALEHLARAIADHRAAGGRVVTATHTDLHIPDAARLEVDRFSAATPTLAEAEDGW